MAHPVSVRFQSPVTAEHLRREAAAHRRSTSSLAEELIEEGLRMRRHPMIVFREGATGRRAAVRGGPDVWEMMGGVVGGDIPVEQRIDRAVDEFGWSRVQVTAALAYYAEFTDEIDAELADNKAAADELEALWLRQQELLAS